MTATLLLIFNRLFYNIGRGFFWETDPIFGMLVARAGWVPNRDDDFVQTIITAGAVELTDGSYGRIQLTTPVVGLDDPGDRATWSGDSFDFGPVDGTELYDTFVMYRMITDDTDSELMAAWDLGTQTTDADPIDVQPTSSLWFPWYEDLD